MTTEERAKEIVKDMAPLLKKIPSMIFELQRESKRERKREMDERSKRIANERSKSS